MFIVILFTDVFWDVFSGFFNDAVDPVWIFGHEGVNAWFSWASASVSPADDPVQETHAVTLAR